MVKNNDKKQHTISGSFGFQGKGLHTGLKINLKFVPAPENTGIKIKRVDLPGEPEMEAVADYVCQTQRGTVLKKGDIQVSTIEHAMASLYSLGIDNCILEVDAPEFPILDGSAKLFVEKILETGITEQEAERDFFRINESFTFVNEKTGSEISVVPADKFSVEVEIGFKSEILKNQTAKITDISDFAEDFSSARTFVFVREIEPLLNMNLIKGGDLKNAVVIYDDVLPQETLDNLADKLSQPHIDASKLGYITGDLFFENEPARHKLLDVIGDLALVGKPIIGKVKAVHPGHHTNTELAKIIRNAMMVK